MKFQYHHVQRIRRKRVKESLFLSLYVCVCAWPQKKTESAQIIRHAHVCMHQQQRSSSDASLGNAYMSLRKKTYRCLIYWASTYAPRLGQAFCARWATSAASLRDYFRRERFFWATRLYFSSRRRRCQYVFLEFLFFLHIWDVYTAGIRRWCLRAVS